MNTQPKPTGDHANWDIIGKAEKAQWLAENQPKPTTGEWTEERLRNVMLEKGITGMVDAINAAVKEAYEKGKQDGFGE